MSSTSIADALRDLSRLYPEIARDGHVLTYAGDRIVFLDGDDVRRALTLMSWAARIAIERATECVDEAEV